MEGYNSPRNQRIKEMFVEREVYASVTTIIEFILKVSNVNPDTPFSQDDIANAYLYEDTQGVRYTELERDRELISLKEQLEEKKGEFKADPENDAFMSSIYALENEIESLEEAQYFQQEIFEWWLVSPFLAKKLASFGEPALSDGQNHFWGRGTTGQAILLDDVISEICDKLEILAGQKHEWKE